jgi:hypothetical protein
MPGCDVPPRGVTVVGELGEDPDPHEPGLVCANALVDMAAGGVNE